MALVQAIAVEAAELVLPESLPLGEHQFLELAMLRRSGRVPLPLQSRSGP